MRKIKLYYLFFLGTLKINVPLSLLFSLLISKGDGIVFYESLFYMLGGVGIITTFLFKEALEKDAYFFYYNAGIPKRWLIASVFAAYWFILLIIKLCVICLR